MCRRGPFITFKGFIDFVELIDAMKMIILRINFKIVVGDNLSSKFCEIYNKTLKVWKQYKVKFYSPSLALKKVQP